MFSDIFFRLRALVLRKSVESELDEELRTHFDNEVERHLRAGMPRQEADRRARLAIGGFEQIKEECREARGVHFLESTLKDIRYALRMLRNSPGFTVVAVLTLALGIGANTAIFSLLNGLALRDLSVLHPEQLVRFGLNGPGEIPSYDSFMGLSVPIFLELSQRQKVFSGTLAWWGNSVLNVEVNGALFRADICAVTGNFYSELGAQPELGRLLTPGDVNLSASAPDLVAVLGYGFWQRHYGGSPDVLGKIVKIEGVPFTVIGVARQDFRGMMAESPIDVAVPLTTEPLVMGDPEVQKHLQRRDALWLEAAGRLKSGSTVEAARAQLESLWPAVQQTMLPATQDLAQRNRFLALRMYVMSGAKGASFLRRRFLKPLYVLLGIAGVVLLLACVNLASLMLARAASRAHELGVRVALGASKVRLVRQMLTESLTLSVSGTLAGFAFAHWGSRMLADFILGQTSTIPTELNLAPDAHILEFTAAASMLTGVLFGIVPAWRATREDPNIALQQTSRTSSGTGRLGRGLIVTQISLSLVLLAASGLFIRSFLKLRAVEPGFRTREVIAAGLFPKPGGYKNINWATYDRELLGRLSRLTAVESVGSVQVTPGSVYAWTEKTRVSGTTSEVTSDFVMLTPGSFEPLGISLLRGRSFTWQDDQNVPKVAVLSENLAKRFFPAGDAVGRHLDITSQPKWQNLEIVGIVSDASYYNIRKAPQPTVYVSGIQYADFMGYSDLLIQTKASPAALLESVRQLVDSFGHEYVFSARTIGQLIDKSILQERITALLSVFFGALALLLGAIGLYGLMAYNVTSRTREIGIRIALGAPRKSVRWMILRETFALALTGVVIGVPCAIAASLLIAGMLFGLSPYDPATLLMVVPLLLAVGALAGYLPARRATKVDPLVALRCN